MGFCNLDICRCIVIIMKECERIILNEFKDLRYIFFMGKYIIVCLY